MSKEAMKLALEALEAATPVKAKDPQMQADAIVALREALADQPAQQPAPVAKPRKQEPVAYAVYHRMGGSKSLHWSEQHSPDGDSNEYQLLPLYTSPQAQPAQQEPVAWMADVQKVRDALDPEDWCGDERMIDVLDRALAQKPCCSNMAAGTSCLADPHPNCPMLAAPQPAQRKPLPTFTTGHCKEKAKAGGCQLHNIQCGFPACDRKES